METEVSVEQNGFYSKVDSLNYFHPETRLTDTMGETLLFLKEPCETHFKASLLMLKASLRCIISPLQSDEWPLKADCGSIVLNIYDHTGAASDHRRDGERPARADYHAAHVLIHGIPLAVE